jgi:hypothetical protein
MTFKSKSAGILLTTLIILSVSGCLKVKSKTTSHPSSGDKEYKIGLNLTMKPDTSLEEAFVSGVSVKMTCGLDEPFTFIKDYPKGVINFTLFEDQQDCKLKLMSFSLGIDEFIPVTGEDFTSYEDDDLANFYSRDDNIKVKVESQLPTIINGDQNVSYSFTQVVKGGDSEVEKLNIKVTNSYVIVSGDTPPQIEVLEATVVNTAQQFTAIRFKFSCKTTWDQDYCEGIGLAEMKVAFITDPSGLDADSLSELTYISLPGKNADGEIYM